MSLFEAVNYDLDYIPNFFQQHWYAGIGLPIGMQGSLFWRNPLSIGYRSEVNCFLSVS